jgi:hypothetical protein
LETEKGKIRKKRESVPVKFGNRRITGTEMNKQKKNNAEAAIVGSAKKTKSQRC